jgi:hypothetical protein
MRTCFLLLLIATLAASCTSQPPFIGEWQRHVISVSHPEGTTEFLTFSRDGVLTLRPPPFADMADTGHYQVVDQHRIRVDLYGVSGICTTRVERAELRFTDPSGHTTIYERVR